jgi:cell fate regulator YaaT (PSP1 superfamily)
MRKEKHGSNKDKGTRGGPSVKPDFQDLPENIWRARIVPTNDFEYCSPPEGIEIERGDFVVISTRYGLDMARILGPVADTAGIDAEHVRRIDRIATDQDLALREDYSRREETAYKICREKVAKLKLSMKLVSAHYILDESKVMFFFTAENRIDFRELVKDLVSHFKMRIELRQIGVRDESRVVGGVAVCGRQYCCHGLTDKLSPVSIKMAKEQNLSLNSLKISGPCGRLLCCLAFEHDHYSTERKNLPREGSRITYEGVSYKVTEINVFTRKVHLIASEGRHLDIPSSRLKRKDGGGWRIMTEDAVEESAAPG